MLMFCIKKYKRNRKRNFIHFKKRHNIIRFRATLMYVIEFLQNYKFCSMISQQHTYLDLTPFILLKYT